MEQTENFIQQSIVMWFTNTFCCAHHNPKCKILSIPNGGSRDGREAKNLKNTGLLKGASDLIIIIPGKTIYVEVKTKIGIQSTDQKVFESDVKSLDHCYYLVRSLQEFKTIFTFLKK